MFDGFGKFHVIEIAIVISIRTMKHFIAFVLCKPKKKRRNGIYKQTDNEANILFWPGLPSRGLGTWSIQSCTVLWDRGHVAVFAWKTRAFISQSTFTFCMIAHQARYLNKYSNNYLIVIFDLLIGALTAFIRIRNLAEIVWDRQTILQEFVSAKCPQAQSA